MNPWTRFSLAVRRRETPFYDRLYKIAKRCKHISVPVIPGLHRFLYSEWAVRTRTWHNFWRVVYYEPMFKARCCHVGKNFRLEYAGNGICRIYGNLQLYIGDNVTFFDNLGLVGTRVYDSPSLTIGSETYIGPASRILVAKEITIGSHTVIGGGALIVDNPGHPEDAASRLGGGGGLPTKESVRPVTIGDYCFFGGSCLVYPGTHVGDGVFARSRAQLVGTIPPFSVVAGTPATVRRLLVIPETMKELVGEERYQGWLAAQDAYAQEHPEVARENKT